MYLLKERGGIRGLCIGPTRCPRRRGGGRSLQGARDLGSGGARHRGRVGVGDVLGRLGHKRQQLGALLEPERARLHGQPADDRRLDSHLYPRHGVEG